MAERIYEQALRVALEERIAALWRYRQWYRVNRWADWPDIRKESDVELRALVRLARVARKAAQPFIERADPMTMATSYAEWTEGERQAVRG